MNDDQPVDGNKKHQEGVDLPLLGDMTTYPEVAVKEAAEGDGAPDLAAQTAMRTIFSRLRLGVAFAVSVAALVALAAANEMAQFVATGFQTHTALGWVNFSAVALVTVLVALLVLRDVMAWRRLSATDHLRGTYDMLLAAPKDPDLRLKTQHHVRGYLSKLRREASPQLLQRLDRLRGKMDVADDPVGWQRDIDDTLLKPWDEEVGRLVLGEALRVGLATAASPYAFLDAIIVLWRNVLLIRRIAAVYRVRPGMMGTVRLICRVAVALAVADISQRLVTVSAGATGGFAKRWVGPLGQGLTNAAMTCHIGLVAKEACRPLRPAHGQTLQLMKMLVAEVLGRLRRLMKKKTEEEDGPMATEPEPGNSL